MPRKTLKQRRERDAAKEQEDFGFDDTPSNRIEAIKDELEIYINYGDSRRIIELCSGMEKMMASLAIRFVLTNLSTLPRSSMLVIDEGFGALDSGNIDACNEFLESMKKWYKNILIISHIDVIKDSVDNIMEITRNGIDSKVRFE